MKRRMGHFADPPLMTRARDNVALVVAAWTMAGTLLGATITASWRVFTWDNRVASLETAHTADELKIAGMSTTIDALNAQRETEAAQKRWLAEYLRTNPVGKH
jgi:hypothetical protein